MVKESIEGSSSSSYRAANELMKSQARLCALLFHAGIQVRQPGK
jgi:hypothetical protein